MMKRIKLKKSLPALVSAVLWLAGGFLSAHGAEVGYIRLYDATGETMRIKMLPDQEIRFDDGNLCIFSSGDVVMFDLGSLERWEYAKETVSENQNSPQICLNNQSGVLEIEGAEEETVSIYSLKGYKVSEEKMDVNHQISLNHLSPGIYIVKIGTSTFKINIQ